ncbi:paraquat-inducible protein A [Microbulbifer sp. 2205BS26-8]|uniref:paraquat-inducible protein A n=1 Tax=Microbulbifer sp. 2205BS26-8 TaxID=3064386 RepID=UPI0027402923|nr:paraquat-inducible protein A [Microbulbifer sp. 2205BS26-8]MDP5208493.1 paraquat-inducible protein A [Microbulbifer sp. 2205BS26-8]
MSVPYKAFKQGLTSCLCCHQLIILPAAGRCRCPRCGARVYGRIDGSLMSTWALTITGALLLLPANILPVMTVTYLGAGEPNTIISGVMQLYNAGMWGIALVVFAASIAVPVMKLLGLALLLVQIQLRIPFDPLQAMKIYRVVSGIGRWSLLDLFILSILVALVDMGFVAQVDAGPGSTAFAAVVVITMTAARTFDPRLIWDARDGDRGNTAVVPQAAHRSAAENG